MRYTDEKENLKRKILKLRKELEHLLPSSSQLKVLTELEEDITEDYYTIMVVGEFKHGKSTFVNALLGQDIMPRDVTPTTATINAVFHSETPELHILKTDGQVEQRELTVNELNQYTASADFNVDEIKYLKLYLNAPLLENRVVLVDTPGVNDLNQQRSDVTFQFLPRADVIIFMTSMDAAIKQTEKTFIEEFLLKNGLDKIIFAANFMDRIDEEELDDTIEYIERRLQNIVGEDHARLFPLSSREALEGKLSRDEELVKYSGIPEIEKEIAKRIESGSRSMEKLERFQWRLKGIAETVKDEIATAVEVSSQSLESLESQLQAIEDWFSNQEVWRGQLQSYLKERHNEISYMVRKSVQHFGTGVREDIENRIRLYHGAEIKNLVESQIPIAVKSQFNGWVNQYSDYILELLRKTQAEVIKGLTASFKQTVHIHAVRGSDLQFNESIPILSARSGNANVKAGLVVGGVSTIAMLLGGPFFLPIVGMAGLPFLSQKLAERQLEIVKPEIISAAGRQISQLVDNLEDQINLYVKKNMEQIEMQSLEEFTRLLRSYELILKGEINGKQKEADFIQEHQVKLSKLNEMIEKEILEGVQI
ncbi:isoniazid inductible protein IniC [Mycobacteroides abscessus subsp. abscessus]|nr:isoniazid inductible protein IniC [Mycobacteroides abscessus subsp. abscessus]